MKIYHVYAMDALDCKIVHYLIKAKSEDDAAELFSATDDDVDTSFIVVRKKINKIHEHKHIISAVDIGE